MTLDIGQTQQLLLGIAPPNNAIDIVLPPGIGLRSVRLNRADTPLTVGFLGATLPPPPVVEATPDESFEQVKSQQAQEAKSWVGWAAGSIKRASTALEDKARAEAKQKDRDRFERLFPDLAPLYDVVADYKCKSIGGAGMAREGHMSILTKKSSTSEYAIAFAQPDGSGKYMFDLADCATITVGNLLGSAVPAPANNTFLWFVTCSMHVFGYTEFQATFMASVGSVVSSNLKGTPFSRCVNWADHCWRAACPVLPHPRFQNYDRTMPAPDRSLLGEQHGGSSSIGNASFQQSAGGAAYTQAQPPSSSSSSPGAATAGAAAPAAGTTGQECVVCFEGPKSAFFQPCGHIAVCMGCARKLQTCPVCRSSIVQVFQAYVA